jgi:hypothetical protein
VKNSLLIYLRKILALFLCFCVFALNFPLSASSQSVPNLPSSPEVVSGNVSFSNIENNLNINSQSNKSIINWQSFDIGNGFSVNISQPTSV